MLHKARGRLRVSCKTNPMHIPDGFLNNGVSSALFGVAATMAAVAWKKVRASFLEKVPVFKLKLATFPNVSGGAESHIRKQLSTLGREKVWRMAAVGSFIFAAQMVNFPISGGVSGHLLGGTLAAIILGPFEAFFTLLVILATQAFMFGDGGFLALGANIMNMGVVGALGGFAFFRFLTRGETKRRFLSSAFVAAWISVIVAAVAASYEIALSGTGSLETVLPAMTLAHIAIGFVEGIITVLVLAVLVKKQYRLAVFEKQETYEK